MSKDHVFKYAPGIELHMSEEALRDLADKTPMINYDEFNILSWGFEEKSDHYFCIWLAYNLAWNKNKDVVKI